MILVDKFYIVGRGNFSQKNMIRVVVFSLIPTNLYILKRPFVAIHD